MEMRVVVATPRTLTVTESASAPEPTASFSVTPTVCFAPCTVKVENTSMDAISFAWDFDDNTTGNQSNSPFEHIYENSGTYEINMTATGEGGSSAATPITVTVNAPTFSLSRVNWNASQEAITSTEYFLRVELSSSNTASDLSGKSIQFSVSSGGGKVNGSTQIVALTNSSGQATASWELGTELFIENKVSVSVESSGISQITLNSRWNQTTLKIVEMGKYMGRLGLEI